MAGTLPDGGIGLWLYMYGIDLIFVKMGMSDAQYQCPWVLGSTQNILRTNTIPHPTGCNEGAVGGGGGGRFGVRMVFLS